jgi:hypothetical protein
MSRHHPCAASGARATLWAIVALAACTPSLDLGHNGARVTPSSTTVIVPQGGAPVVLDVALEGDSAAANVAFIVDDQAFPNGLSYSLARTSAATETITFSATPGAAAGDYNASVTARNEATGATSAPFVVTVAVSVKVGRAPDPTLGVGGLLEEVSTTSFQPASFQTFIPTPSDVATLHPPHPLVQIYQPPWTPTGGWNFATLDSFVGALLPVSTDGPELQIAVPPNVPGTLDPSGTQFDFTNPANVKIFADYCANLVSYYNQGGFTDDMGNTVTNPAGTDLKVTWWGILSDFNNPDPTGGAYTSIYNQVAAAMLNADTSIKLSALEFTDNSGADSPMAYLPAFVLPADGGGVNQPVDAVSVHMYSTSLPGQIDTQIFPTVPLFGQDISFIRNMLQMRRPDLASVPIWVTQSNVNSLVPKSSAMMDVRGTSAFFAAWAPYMFSQLGRNGAATFSHWDYTAGHDPGDASLDFDLQNAEVNYDTGLPFLSYWVDLALAQTYPPGVDPAILQTTTTDDGSSPTTDVLVTQRDGTKVVVMFEDIAVADPKDNNGPGAPRTVVVDLSQTYALLPPGTQYSATRLTIDAATDITGGPTAQSVIVPSDLSIPLSLPGYGVTFLTVTPTQ